MIKLDIRIPSNTIEFASVSHELKSATNHYNTVVGYTAELNIGGIIIYLDEIAQLDGIIEELGELRKLWAEKTSNLVR
jgi:hypothetical protein